MIHLLIGPVGAGKSTLAARLCREHHAVHLDLDAWMARLYGPDPRPESERIAWYRERTERCLGLMWELTEALVAVGAAVVLEPGLVRRLERQAFYERVDLGGHPLRVILVDAERDLRRERVRRRNAERGPTWSMDVPMPFFELASDLWEPPTEQERAERDVLDLSSG